MTPARIGPRRRLLALLILLGFAASWIIGLDLRDLHPGEGGVRLAKKFFTAALRPELSAAGQASLGMAVVETLKIAFAAIGLSLTLGFCIATACTESTPRGIRMFFRGLAAVLRSVHELLWATLFLAAFGMTPIAAVIALSIPYTGTFAKIFSEMIDEAQAGPATALQSGGASRLQSLFFARVPMTVADMTSYALYRFECAIRSSAVMGFMGITTLGYYLSTAYENALYNEVWAYLYVLIALVFFFEKWSDLIRKKLHTGVAA